MQKKRISRRHMLKLAGMAGVLSVFAPASFPVSVRAAEPGGKSILVVYFSMPETDNPHNMTREEENSTVVVNGKVLGNTQYVAQLIRGMTGGDLFRIEPEKPYPTDHRTLVELAKDERNGTPDRPSPGRLETWRRTIPYSSAIPIGGPTCR